MRITLLLFWSVIFMPLIAACDSAPSPDGGPQVDGGGGDGVHDVYEDGVRKSGDTFDVSILQADPAPPDRGDNTWTLQVTEDGSPASDLQVTLSPFMPAHNHGTTPADFVAEPVPEQPGTYIVGPFDLFMPGSWSLVITLEGDGLDDDVEFFFAIEG